MDQLQAVDYLRRRARMDNDVKMIVAACVDKGGYADLFDWADAEPEQVVLVAESAQTLDEETSEFARRLSTGDLT